jgi:hypothetical protein
MHRLVIASSLVLAILTTTLPTSVAGCTPAERQTAAGVISAAAPIACTLVPVFAGNGPFAGTVCQDVATLIADVLSAIPASVRPALAPCSKLELLSDPAGRPVGYMCPAYLETAKTALTRSTP